MERTKRNEGEKKRRNGNEKKGKGKSKRNTRIVIKKGVKFGFQDKKKE